MLSRISVVIVVGVLSGCHLLELRRQNAAEGEAIDRAYAAHDADALEPWIQNVQNTVNKDKAREHFVELRTRDLLAFDCATFDAAFRHIDTRDARGTLTTKLDPRGSFGYATAKMTSEQRDAFVRDVFVKAARCKSAALFSTAIRNVTMPEGGNRRWIELLVDLDKHGEPVFPAFVEMLRRSSDKSWFEMATALAWLTRSRSADDCHELEVAARSADINTHAMLIVFYGSSGCRAEGVNVAKELIAARTPLYRARACQAMRVLGDGSLVPQMKLLAEHDMARDIQQQDIGMWTIAYLTHPVREVCQDALNELRLKSIARGT